MKNLICMAASLVIAFSIGNATSALASKCYGEEECGACKNCNYCKHCNSGTDHFCGVYYESRGVIPPWKKKQQNGAAKKKAA